MRDNPHIAAFIDRLEAAGVHIRVLWSARRPISEKYDDIFFVTFIGDGFRPSVPTAMILDYGADNGFGLFLERTTNSIEEDVFHIASVPGHPLPVPGRRA